MQWLEVIFSY